MKHKFFFYFLSFLEGASVMAAELLGAKMLAPFFGTSLYVWSSVLAVTLGGLAMGYFAGGIFSEKKNTERNLYLILLASAIFLIMMPMIAKVVMIHTAGLSLLSSIVVSSFVFLFPPVFFMGMVSPMIVQCLLIGNHNFDQQSGKAAGTVYAISTFGGIVSTFLLGFYFIPEFGLIKPAIVMGAFLGVIPFFKLIVSKNYFSFIFLPIVVGVVFFSFYKTKYPLENSDIKILYSSEGMLGQIIVADYPIFEGEKIAEGSQRILFVNRSTQTIVKFQNGKKSFFDYVHLITDRVHSPSNESHALVLGLGGGVVANELVKNGFQVDAVELDERIPKISKRYFDLDEKINVHVDDARHFIRSEISSQKLSGIKSQYDVIVLDAFIGESNPHHLFTKEFFEEVQSLLSDSGKFFINGNGFWNGEVGRGMRSICKTLISSGFDVDVVPSGVQEEYRNLVLVARHGNSRVKGDEMASVNLDDAIILSDEKPQLEILNAEANKRWREGCIKYFLSAYYSKKDMLIFK